MASDGPNVPVPAVGVTRLNFIPRGTDSHTMPVRAKRFCYDCQYCKIPKGGLYNPRDYKMIRYWRRLSTSPKGIHCERDQWEKKSTRLYSNLMATGMQNAATQCRFYEYMGGD